MANIKHTTRQQIADEIGGDFVLVSLSTFQPFDNVTRTRYTVRRPKGAKFIHLIGFEDGTIKKS